MGDTIGEFEARIQNQGDSDEGLPIHIQIKGERFRVWAGANRLGSWPLEEVEVERLTPFRFRVVVEGDPMIVIPDDPTGFAVATNAFIDARTPRFGLAARLRSDPLASFSVHDLVEKDAHPVGQTSTPGSDQ